jgi:hypothetical protein
VTELACQRCGAVVARVYATDDGVHFAGRVRDTARATERAVIMGVGRRRHRRDSWAATETALRGSDYADVDPEAWCPRHGRMTMPDLGQHTFGVWGHTTGRQRREAMRRGWTVRQLVERLVS